MRQNRYTILEMIVLAIVVTTGCATVKKPAVEKPAVETTAFTEKEILDTSLPVSTPAEYVAIYYDYRIPVQKDIHGIEAARKKATQRAVAELKTKAFIEAANDISATLSRPIPADKCEKMAVKAGKRYPEFLTEWKLLKQEAEAAGDMVISVYFKINRKALKDAMIASIETKELAFEEKEIMSFTAPASTPTIYVVTFNNYCMDVPEIIKDRDAARRQTAQRIINDMKLKAFHEAAQDINHALAQPMEKDEFARAVKKASKDYPNFIMDWEMTNQVVVTRGPLSVQPEFVKLSAYFRIDKKLLKQALVRERAITPVAKYRTYVELFWNVPEKDVHPEAVDTILASVEDYFAQKGYEVVQFEQIKGNLVQRVKEEGRNTDDLFSKDEVTRFKANLELRNIDKKFVNGKRILADYANLLIGVTIKAVEQRGGMLHVRLATDATLFERGTWVTLAHSEQTASIPFRRGHMDNLTEVSRRAAVRMSTYLEPKIRKKLALRTTLEEITTTEIRDFVLVFKDMDKTQFAKTKSLLRGGSKWEFKGADFQTKTVHLGYEGRIDSLAERVGIYLEGARLNLGVPEYSTSGNRILFGTRK